MSAPIVCQSCGEIVTEKDARSHVHYCTGALYYISAVPVRPTCEHRDRLGERYEHVCVGAP